MLVLVPLILWRCAFVCRHTIVTGVETRNQSREVVQMITVRLIVAAPKRAPARPAGPVGAAGRSGCTPEGPSMAF
ncbi:hypothetical protein SR870_16445 [Rhodopseudomonas palustris]|uniref:hypothetical protein n=1 Tax=Rhodopseudomonas palustris TaxID=1076 RepID=UPI002ACD7157|nr:hypothetical protein [Rhodopseudomonas palustris]WQG98286.1 hypothetical protein SR870_16445 [Rhodopseudomonas palustris]